MPPVHVGEWSGGEKRRHKRVSLHVAIECRSDQATLEGRGENISVSGLLIRTPTPFAEDEEITLRFTLPGSSDRIECRARVAHSVPDSFMGVEFVDLPDALLERIEEYIATAATDIHARIKK
ncbi:MAG: PilZ domain-containing protein [Terriglobia bacterium]